MAAAKETKIKCAEIIITDPWLRFHLVECSIIIQITAVAAM